MPEPIRAGSTNNAAISFQAAKVVLEEQRAGLHALGERGRELSPGIEPDRRLSMWARSRLVEMGIRVLVHAMLTTEAECRRIVVAAEAQAAAVVQEARDDAERLAGWFDAGTTYGDDAGNRAAQPLNPSAQVETAPSVVNQPAPDPFPVEELAADIADEFFASFPVSESDPWSFMNDDDLAGAGPPFLRRMRRRPQGPRQERVS